MASASPTTVIMALGDEVTLSASASDTDRHREAYTETAIYVRSISGNQCIGTLTSLTTIPSPKPVEHDESDGLIFSWSLPSYVTVVAPPGGGITTAGAGAAPTAGATDSVTVKGTTAGSNQVAQVTVSNPASSHAADPAVTAPTGGIQMKVERVDTLSIATPSLPPLVTTVTYPDPHTIRTIVGDPAPVGNTDVTATPYPSVTHNLLPAGWSLARTAGELEFVPDASQPKLKGRITIPGAASVGTATITAKCGPSQLSMQLVKYCLNIAGPAVVTAGAPAGSATMFAFKTPNRDVGVTLTVSLNSGGTGLIPDGGKFDWAVVSGGDKIATPFTYADADQHACGMMPAGYTHVSKDQTEPAIIRVSCKVSGVYAHTDISVFVRTPMEIATLHPGQTTFVQGAATSGGWFSQWTVYYFIKDNWGRTMPGGLVKSIMMRETVNAPWNPEIGDAPMGDSGFVVDVHGGTNAIVHTGETGEQTMNFDDGHVIRKQTITFDDTSKVDGLKLQVHP